MPSENASKPPGEWQTFDITLVDRHLTVIHNGKKTIDNQPVLGARAARFGRMNSAPAPFIFRAITPAWTIETSSCGRW